MATTIAWKKWKCSLLDVTNTIRPFLYPDFFISWSTDLNKHNIDKIMTKLEASLNSQINDQFLFFYLFVCALVCNCMRLDSNIINYKQVYAIIDSMINGPCWLIEKLLKTYHIISINHSHTFSVDISTTKV